MKHAPPQLDLKKALRGERHLLQKAQLPIVTVSATFKKELGHKYRTLYHTASDVVYSRAHYSMAEAVRQQALLANTSAHLVDPTNFVSQKNWHKIAFTEKVGQLMARHKLLKWFKDQIDTVARNQLPISGPITPPLLYLTCNITAPIVSLHYEAGNILAQNNRHVIQVLTDPHVRPQYLDPLQNVSSANSLNKSQPQTPKPQIQFCVFDHQTKTDLITKANKANKQITPEQIIITGPPVDPRITKLGSKPKTITKNSPLNLGLTTGGLGTNLSEIKTLLEQLTPLLTPPEKIRLFLYAGTHRDFRNFFETYADKHHIRIGNLDDDQARIRILYEDSIIDANENLISYLFPWAHGIITKPSGDMAYDAAAAGCFLLFLQPWGQWEQNIQTVFTKNGVGFDLNANSAHTHFSKLLTSNQLASAQTKAKNLPLLFRQGAKNIFTLHTKLSLST